MPFMSRQLTADVSREQTPKHMALSSFFKAVQSS